MAPITPLRPNNNVEGSGTAPAVTTIDPARAE